MAKFDKKRGIILFAALSAFFFISITIFVIISNVYGLVNAEEYKNTFVGLLVFNIISLFLIVLAEIISLSFDKTASLYTLYAAISIFLSLFFSRDTIYSATYVGINIPNTWLTICELLCNAPSLLFAYFIFEFLRHDFKLKNYNIIHYIVMPLMVGLIALFSLFNIGLGALIVSIIEALYVLVFVYLYSRELRTQKNKNNPLPAHISLIMVAFTSIAMVFHALAFHRDIGFVTLGIHQIYFIIIFFGFITIYVDFLIDKTKKSYVMEEEIKNAKKPQEVASNGKIKVTCFHTFDCFMNDKLLKFPSKKSKEFFALLIVLHGKSLTMDKAITYLWPDKDLDLAKISYRDVIWKLRKYLESIKFKGITFERGLTTIDPKYIECDYYDVIDKKTEYNDEPFMPEYDWSIDFENNF